MWIMGKHFNNRAVSAVIATLLLIAIAVAAAIIVYVFSIGLLGGLQTSGGQQVKQQIIMEAYNWSTLLLPQLTLRNVGPASAQFADWFVNGATVTPQLQQQVQVVFWNRNTRSGNDIDCWHVLYSSSTAT